MALTDGVATDVSGEVGGTVSVTVSPVVRAGGSTSFCAPAKPPLKPTPTTAIANPAAAPTPADATFSFRRFFAEFT